MGVEDLPKEEITRHEETVFKEYLRNVNSDRDKLEDALSEVGDGVVAISKEGKMILKDCYLAENKEWTEEVKKRNGWLREKGARHTYPAAMTGGHSNLVFFVVSANGPISIFNGGNALLRSWQY